MTELRLHTGLVWSVLALAAVTVIALLFIVAPYGRHERPGWGPTIPVRLAWLFMELPASVGFAAVFAFGDQRASLAPLVLLGMWQVHYVHRTFIYPLRLRAADKRMPLLIVALGFSFNCLNAWVNARWISALGQYGADWLTDGRFIAGAAIFVAGMGLNHAADRRLIQLRKVGEGSYVIPRGGVFRWVSCPNYLGEIIEWIGWAIATWSLAGLAFAVFTAANLGPRAIRHHRWYRQAFEDYPPERRALVPFIL